MGNSGERGASAKRGRSAMPAGRTGPTNLAPMPAGHGGAYGASARGRQIGARSPSGWAADGVSAWLQPVGVNSAPKHREPLRNNRTTTDDPKRPVVLFGRARSGVQRESIEATSSRPVAVTEPIQPLPAGALRIGRPYSTARPAIKTPAERAEQHRDQQPGRSGSPGPHGRATLTAGQPVTTLPQRESTASPAGDEPGARSE